MERKIGEIFEYNGEWYQCVEGNCTKCDFFIKRGYVSPLNTVCGKRIRKDKQNVIFKKLERVGDPYLTHDHSRNKDVVVQDYKLCNQHACYNGHEEMLIFGFHGRNEIVTIKSKDPIKSLNCEDSVEIEIKQTKEDMEENKLNLKPFDIQKAREGKPVCTRDGRKARIICFDRKDNTPIIALIECVNHAEILQCVHNDGKCFHYDTSNNDLMMLPEKNEGWVNVYKGGLLDTKSYPTKKEAFDKACPRDYVDTVKIEWEE